MINGKGCLRIHGGLFLRYYPKFAQELRKVGKICQVYWSPGQDICKQKGV
jgi:hypothetical protein